MAVPLKEYAIKSEQGRAILDHKIVRTVLNQAEYQAFSSHPDSCDPGEKEQSIIWNFVPDGRTDFNDPPGWG
jgi:hypothetical protein